MWCLGFFRHHDSRSLTIKDHCEAQFSWVSGHGVSSTPEPFEHHCKNVQTRNTGQPITLLAPASIRRSHPDLVPEPAVCSSYRHHAPYGALRDQRIDWESGRGQAIRNISSQRIGVVMSDLGQEEAEYDMQATPARDMGVMSDSSGQDSDGDIPQRL
jgi:hypothetical protein